MNRIASFGSIAYQIGTLTDIGELEFLREAPEKQAFYREAGFEQYAEYGGSLMEMAEAAAAKTLAQSSVDLSKIGMCLFVAASYDRAETFDPRQLLRLMTNLGIPNAYPLQVSGSNCANVLAAIDIALTYLQAAKAEHILVISADKPSLRAEGRKMYNEMSIKSDAAVSCVVSKAGQGEYDVLHLEQANRASQIQILNGMNRSAFMMTKFKLIRSVARATREATNLQPEAYARMLTHNYGKSVMKTLIDLCGFEESAGYFDNLARFAHASAGDVLINLKDLNDTGSLQAGQHLFLLGDSITTCSAMSIQKN